MVISGKSEVADKIIYGFLHLWSLSKPWQNEVVVLLSIKIHENDDLGSRL